MAARLRCRPVQAVQTRQQILEMVASRRRLVFAYHFPFPGLGYVRPRNGEGWGNCLAIQSSMTRKRPETLPRIVCKSVAANSAGINTHDLIGGFLNFWLSHVILRGYYRFGNCHVAPSAISDKHMHIGCAPFSEVGKFLRNFLCSFHPVSTYNINSYRLRYLDELV